MRLLLATVACASGSSIGLKDVDSPGMARTRGHGKGMREAIWMKFTSVWRCGSSADALFLTGNGRQEEWCLLRGFGRLRGLIAAAYGVQVTEIGPARLWQVGQRNKVAVQLLRRLEGGDGIVCPANPTAGGPILGTARYSYQAQFVSLLAHDKWLHHTRIKLR